MEAYKPAIWIHNANLEIFKGPCYMKEHLTSWNRIYEWLLLMLISDNNTLDPNLRTFFLHSCPWRSCMLRHWIQSKMVDALSQATLYIHKSYLLSCCNLLEQCKWTSYWVKSADSNICLIYLPIICWPTNLVRYISHCSADKNPPTQVTNSKFQLFPSQREAAFYW